MIPAEREVGPAHHLDAKRGRALRGQFLDKRIRQGGGGGFRDNHFCHSRRAARCDSVSPCLLFAFAPHILGPDQPALYLQPALVRQPHGATSPYPILGREAVLPLAHRSNGCFHRR